MDEEITTPTTGTAVVFFRQKTYTEYPRVTTQGVTTLLFVLQQRHYDIYLTATRDKFNRPGRGRDVMLYQWKLQTSVARWEDHLVHFMQLEPPIIMINSSRPPDDPPRFTISDVDPTARKVVTILMSCRQHPALRTNPTPTPTPPFHQRHTYNHRQHNSSRKTGVTQNRCRPS